MIKYGKHKSGSSKLHPHNVCGICGADNISIARERSQVRQELGKYTCIEAWPGVYVVYPKCDILPILNKDLCQ